MQLKHQSGMTLLEVVLAITIGIIASIGMFGTYRVYAVQAKMDRGKLIVNTLRNSIHFYQQTVGVYPTQAQIQANDMSPGLSRPFYGDTVSANNPLPVDPFKTVNTVLSPCNLATRTDAGGWCYDAVNGTIFPNLADDEVQYGSDPSTW